MIHKSDTFLHAQATIIGQAGAKLAISHVGEVHANTDSTRSFNIKTSTFGRKRPHVPQFKIACTRSLNVRADQTGDLILPVEAWANASNMLPN